MRELAPSEILAVSGCGMIQDITTTVGKQAGSLIGNILGSLIPVPFISGLVGSVASTLFGNIGGWLGSFVGGLV